MWYQSPSPDHKALCLSLRPNTNKRGKGYWKINNGIINQKEFEDGIQYIYDEICNEYEQHVSKCIPCEYFKLKVKKFSISFRINQAKKLQDECKMLELELDRIDKQLAVTLCDALSAQRRVFKAKLNEQYRIKAIGYQIRSRFKWVELGEQSTRYFGGLEKSRQSHNCICSLTDSNGNTVYSDEEMLDVTAKYYSDLYANSSPSELDIDTFFESVQPEYVLNTDMQQRCEGLFTKEECFNVISNGKFSL